MFTYICDVINYTHITTEHGHDELNKHNSICKARQERPRAFLYLQSLCFPHISIVITQGNGHDLRWCESRTSRQRLVSTSKVSNHGVQHPTLQLHTYNFSGAVMTFDLSFNFGGFSSTTVTINASSEAGRSFLSSLVGDDNNAVASLEVTKSSSQQIWERAVNSGLATI